jgi:hypothetical protein
MMFQLRPSVRLTDSSLRFFVLFYTINKEALPQLDHLESNRKIW